MKKKYQKPHTHQHIIETESMMAQSATAISLDDNDIKEGENAIGDVRGTNGNGENFWSD